MNRKFIKIDCDFLKCTGVGGCGCVIHSFSSREHLREYTFSGLCGHCQYRVFYKGLGVGPRKGRKIQTITRTLGKMP